METRKNVFGKGDVIVSQGSNGRPQSITMEQVGYALTATTNFISSTKMQKQVSKIIFDLGEERFTKAILRNMAVMVGKAINHSICEDVGMKSRRLEAECPVIVTNNYIN